jgi:hypothetical protein
MAKKLIEVAIIESERGWGSKVEETKEFESRKEAEKFVAEYNEKNTEDYAKTGIVPEWYMYARIVES